MESFLYIYTFGLFRLSSRNICWKLEVVHHLLDIVWCFGLFFSLSNSERTFRRDQPLVFPLSEFIDDFLCQKYAYFEVKFMIVPFVDPHHMGNILSIDLFHKIHRASALSQLGINIISALIFSRSLKLIWAGHLVILIFLLWVSTNSHLFVFFTIWDQNGVAAGGKLDLLLQS